MTLRYHFHSTGFWFTFMGRGLSIAKRRLYFSERNGFHKYLKIGPYVIIAMRTKRT